MSREINYVLTAVKLTLTGGSPEVETLAEAEDLIKTLKYIQEREKNLANFSDKLRQAWVTIADIFGKAKYCQICGQPREIHPDKHPVIVEKYGVHDFKPKIEISIDIIDSEPFYSDEESKYYLAIIDHELKISEIPPVAISKPQIYKFTWPMWNAPRYVLKQLTKSGRLPKFLRHVAKTLEKMEAEYKEVSEIAEKLAKALQ
ncbi:MAG: hypothetical protein ACTSXW_08490 [Candidatus Baldrarchaeia archaeon]